MPAGLHAGSTAPVHTTTATRGEEYRTAVGIGIYRGGMVALKHGEAADRSGYQPISLRNSRIKMAVCSGFSIGAIWPVAPSVTKRAFGIRSANTSDSRGGVV